MVTYISEKKAFMNADILVKTASLRDLERKLQAKLDNGEDVKNIELLNHNFKPATYMFEQKTKDCVMVSIKGSTGFYRIFFLEGAM